MFFKTFFSLQKILDAKRMHGKNLSNSDDLTISDYRASHKKCERSIDLLSQMHNKNHCYSTRYEMHLDMYGPILLKIKKEEKTSLMTSKNYEHI